MDTVTRYRGHEFIRRGRNVGPLLLGARVVFAASPRGAWVGDTGTPSAARWSAPGAPDLVVRWTRDLDRTVSEEDVRSGRVLAVHRGELGVETVRVYPVER